MLNAGCGEAQRDVKCISMRRLSISLEDGVYEALVRVSEAEDRPVAAQAARLVRLGVAPGAGTPDWFRSAAKQAIGGQDAAAGKGVEERAQVTMEDSVIRESVVAADQAKAVGKPKATIASLHSPAVALAPRPACPHPAELRGQEGLVGEVSIYVPVFFTAVAAVALVALCWMIFERARPEDEEARAYMRMLGVEPDECRACLVETIDAPVQPFHTCGRWEEKYEEGRSEMWRALSRNREGRP